MDTLLVNIRPETPADYDVVRQINEAAFETNGEASLVDALRVSVSPYISLVAERDGNVLGHILFTPITVDSDDHPWSAMGLAPMAVSPEHQKTGIGSTLVRAGLVECQRIGQTIVFVLGHPEYYPRFGFVSAPPLGLTCEYPVSDEVFMVAELERGAINGRIGLVRYAPAFNEHG